MSFSQLEELQSLQPVQPMLDIGRRWIYPNEPRSQTGTLQHKKTFPLETKRILHLCCIGAVYFLHTFASVLTSLVVWRVFFAIQSGGAERGVMQKKIYVSFGGHWSWVIIGFHKQHHKPAFHSRYGVCSALLHHVWTFNDKSSVVSPV